MVSREEGERDPSATRLKSRLGEVVCKATGERKEEERREAQTMEVLEVSNERMRGGAGLRSSETGRILQSR